MIESAFSALERSLEAEAAGISLYRSGVRESVDAGVRSLLLSILNQKTKRESRLREFLASERLRPGGWPELDLDAPPPAGPLDRAHEFAILDAVVLQEQALQARYARLAEALGGDEDAVALLRMLSDEARKHASWAQDHLDLLTLS